jgi:tripartite-type tricarboxylate transporter receptor subunit TctC
VSAVLGGHATAVYADMAAIVSQVDGGKLKVLAVTGEQRGKSRPDMLTFEEQGVKGLRSSWIGVFAPAGTPKPIVDKLSAAVAAAVRSKEINELIVRGGMEPTGSSAGAMDKRLRGDIQAWRDLARSIGGVSAE